MRINRVKMLSRERAADRAERQALKTALLGLQDAVSALQEHVITKKTGAPTAQEAVNELAETVADVQAEVTETVAEKQHE